jgi:hypothetical protein
VTDLPQADRFCTNRTGDPYWNESAWFSFSIPERKIHGLIYYFFRPNMNLLMGGPAMWDPSGAYSWNCLYFDWHHIQPIPPGAEKFHFTAPNSLAVEVVEPLNRYRIRYDSNGFKLDLNWTAIAAPHHFLGMEIEATGASADNRLHLEQCGRVKGQIEHRGEVYAVDCYSLRDTSYGRRQLDSVARGSYFWAIASAETAFHAMTMGEGDEQKVVGGFLVRDGKLATLARGMRHVTHMGPHTPAEFRFEAEDQLGRTIEVTARTSSDFLFTGFPRCQVVWSLLEVDFGGQTGWGDIQEFTPLEQFRQRARSIMLP